MTTATFTKINGEWGIRGTGLSVGQSVTVTKRNGKTSTVTVAAIVSDSAMGQLATIESARSSRGSSRGYRSTRSGGMCEDAPCCGCCGPQSDSYSYYSDFN